MLAIVLAVLSGVCLVAGWSLEAIVALQTSSLCTRSSVTLAKTP